MAGNIVGGGDTKGYRLWEIRVKGGVGWGLESGLCMLKGAGGSGLSAPRRQPLNPCRPEWWCLS